MRGTIAGSNAGPDLTHLMSRRMIAAGTLPNDSAHLAGWILDPQGEAGFAHARAGAHRRPAQRRHRLSGDAEMTPVRSQRMIADTPEIGEVTQALRDKLQTIWETKPGLIGWLSSVDHKEIGLRYIVTAFILLAIGGSRRW